MKLGRAARFKTNTVVYSNLSLLHVDRDHLASPGHRVVEVVAELDGELVLPRRQLAVEHVLAVAEVHPRRRAFDDRLARREAVLIDADVIVRHPWTGFLQVAWRDG